MHSFTDGVALVTGAGSGIGRALSLELAKRGARVFVTDIDESAAQQTASMIGDAAEALMLDVRSAETFQQIVNDVVARYGRIDYLFNNAGIGVDGEVHELSVAHWDRIIDVNVRGVINGVMAVYPIMREQKFGHIINTASTAGLVAVPFVIPYTMSKFAVVGLSASLRLEAAAYGVKVTTLCPATVETPMLDAGNPSDLPPTRTPQGARRSFLSKFNTPIPSTRVAVECLDGVAENKGFVILPVEARRAWLMSRLFPSLVDGVMTKLLASTRDESAKS